MIGWRGSLVGLAAGLAMLASAPAAPAASMQVQPDGRIVVLGSTWPPFATLARLQPDGTPDPGFGQGGFVLDRRLPPLQALALQPDGRLVGAGAGGSLLARYLPDGSPDPAFAGGGVGGTAEADQPQFLYGGYGPAAVLVRPGGSIVVGGNRSFGDGSGEAWVRGYDAAGGQLEAVGRVPQPGSAISSASLRDLLEAPDGSFFGVGSTYGDDPSKFQTQPFLARFVAGSGSDFDHGFGGSGLARLPLPAGQTSYSTASAVAASGDKLLVAGEREGTFLLARFGRDGFLDPSFGANGFVAPPIVGPGSASPYAGDARGATSRASALAVTADGGIVLGGGTAAWGSWSFDKFRGAYCTQCPQPMLARFDAGGQLDPSFGSGGLLRLLKPDGSVFEGSIDQVVALADGKLLVEGSNNGATPIVARLNRDGSYDPTFGQGGSTQLTFPCAGGSLAQQRRSGCLPSARVKLRVRGWRGGHPALFLRIKSVDQWAALRSAAVFLPRGLRLAPGFRSKTHLLASGGAASRATLDAHQPRKRGGRTILNLGNFGRAGEVRLRLDRGSLRVFRKRSGRHRPALRATVDFTPAGWDIEIGSQTVSRRLG
ncbi:MAG: hypothetical protein ACOYD4_07680 [Solirubrobacterales bacterium]